MTMRKIAFALALGTMMGGGLLRWTVANARQQTGGATAITGQSSTQLADGRWLVLGGESAAGVARNAAIVDPRTGVATPVPMSMTAPRAQHTATLLTDGTVLIVGGRGALGEVIETAELFDPQLDAFMPIAFEGGTPRAGHSATLLSDGRVLVAGGAAAGGRVASELELWDVSAQRVVEAGRLGRARSAQTATLLGDGRVAFSDGVDADGRPVSQTEIFDPRSGRVVAAAPPDDDGAPVRLMESTPADSALDVSVDVRLALRFSRPLRIDTVNASTVALSGSDGPLDVLVVPAEGGRLLFVTPRAPLRNDAKYRLTMSGASDVLGGPLATSPLTFVTVAENSTIGHAPDEEAWAPGAQSNGWKSHRPDSPWRSLSPLQAPPGTTALAGQVLRLDGKPLPDVTLAMEGHSARSDRTGRFLLRLEGLQTGEHTLVIDARTANKPGRTYGFYEARIGAYAGRTTVLPFTIWSPLIDTAHAIEIASPTTGETVVTTPTMPGLELHLPAGTVIRDEDGQVVRKVTMTPIPLDRTPFGLPEEATFTMFFTIQPGGAYLDTPGPIKGGWLVYPRIGQSPPGTRVQFFNYDPDDKGWYVYGMGTARATRVVPDPKTRLYSFTGASFNDGNAPPATGPPPGDCCGNDGDPVNLTTGIFTYEMTDLVVPDVLPLALTRTYNSQDTNPNSPRPFGIGMTHPYAVFLHTEQQYIEADLILPDGGRVHYLKRPESGPDWWQTIFDHTASPTGFYQSRMVFWGGLLSGGGWQVTRKDGTVYVFGHAAPLAAIRDRNGNTVRLTWSTTGSFGSGTGNILRVTSPNGRWIALTYDPSNRITQAQDTLGRTVGYTYTANGELATVTDAEQHVTSYTYDSNHRMLTVKPPNLQGTQTNLVTNEYTTAADAPTPVGWVKKQTHADGGVYQFAYTVANGKSTQTDVTDPRGFVRHVTFNPDGYTLNDTRAVSQSEEQPTTSVRQPSGNFVTSSTDALLHPTTTTYDDNGNVTSVTRLTGAEAVTTTYTYAAFNQVATITDPLTHVTTFGYDTKGNRTSVTDALNHTTAFGYNATGQVTSVTDPLQHTTTFEYTGPDVTKITDPLGRITQRFVDAGGRVLSQTDPLGQITRFEYNKLNQLTRVTDPLAGVTNYTYDTAGRLGTITDARNNPTTYGYDLFNRLASRTDPVAKTETFTYDVDGNATQHVDRKGQVTTRSYDALNRLHQMTLADTSTITYTYDSGNRLTTIADTLNGNITRTYDNLDRLTSEITAQGTVSYTYDPADRRATMTVAGQPDVTTYGYDNANRLTSVAQGTSAVTITYDDADRRSAVTLPNGIVVTYGYDNASQLTNLTYALGQTTLGTLTYTYDLAGRRTDVGGTWARTGLPAAVTSGAYDAANRLTQWAGNLFAHDENGNLASDGVTSYLWNSRDQLVGLVGAASATFQYDTFGRRTGKTVQSTNVTYAYDGPSVIQELAGGVPIVNLLAGLRLDEYFGRNGPSASTFVTDALGSVVAVADSAGAIQNQLSYTPFGQTTVTGAATGNDLGFASRQGDIDGHLYHYRARYYDSQFGRFLSEDPLEFRGGLNLYQYVKNSPTNLIDPFGLIAWTCRYVMGTGNSPVLGYGAGVFRATCTSECTSGQRVVALLLGSIVGISAGPLPFGFASSEVTVHDSSSAPDSRNLEGHFLYASVGVIPIVGPSYTWIELGAARGRGFGLAVGMDIGGDSYAGAVAVTSSKKEKCCPQ